MAKKLASQNVAHASKPLVAHDRAPRSTLLPLPYVRGLNREQAAAFFGVSPVLFSEMVKDGRAPSPRVINTRRVWDVRDLDQAFSLLPHAGEVPAKPEFAL